MKRAGLSGRLVQEIPLSPFSQLNFFKGEEGETGKMELKTSENHLNKFERGNMDVFHFEIENIGTGQNLIVRAR